MPSWIHGGRMDGAALRASTSVVARHTESEYDIKGQAARAVTIRGVNTTMEGM